MCQDKFSQPIQSALSLPPGVHQAHHRRDWGVTIMKGTYRTCRLMVGGCGAYKELYELELQQSVTGEQCSSGLPEQKEAQL